MAVSLILNSSVSYPSDTTATVTVTLKAKSTSGSYNLTSSSYGYIKINGSKIGGNISHTFKANTTTTLGSRSTTITRTTSAQSISTYGWWHTDVSSGNISKSGSQSVAARPVYTVTFNANGGTNGKSVSVYSGYTTTFPTTNRTGYTFGSWDGYAQGATTPAITSSRTYTASWNIINYSIGYTLDGGSISGQQISYNITTTSFTLPIPTKEGYYFVGWTGSNGTTPQRIVTISAGSTGNRTYTANWRLNIYNIVYDFGEAGNQGYWPSEVTVITTKTHNEIITLEQPKWSGHIFAGWKSGDIDLGLNICPANINGSIDGETITLVAVWSNVIRPIRYYYYNSTTNSTDYYEINKIFNSPITELLQPTLENYIFKGWFIDEEHSGRDYWDNSQYKIEALSNFDYDLFSVVTPASGDNPSTNDWYEYDSTTDTFTKSTDTSVQTKTYYRLDYDDPTPLNLYAGWNKVYTVIYNKNNPSYDDGIIATGDLITTVSFEDGTSKTLNSSSLMYSYMDGSSTKCSASGWSLNEGDNNSISTINGTSLTNGASVILSNYDPGYVINLYAVWTPATYTITLYRGNATSGNAISINKTYYETYQFPILKPTSWTYANYNLLSWQLQGTETVVLPGTTITVTDSSAWTAQWVQAYHIPTLYYVNSSRYLDENYTILNDGGKYLQFEASGLNGSYDTGNYILSADTTVIVGKEYFSRVNNTYSPVTPAENANPHSNGWYEKEKTQVDTHKYVVDIEFYDSPELTEAIDVFKKEVTSNTELFNENWFTIDKTLQIKYCVLTIVDVTDYGEGISIPLDNRTFSFSFPITLERAIALHIAEDISAISMFQELEPNDQGLVVKKQANFKYKVNIDDTAVVGRDPIEPLEVTTKKYVDETNTRIKMVVWSRL